MKIIELLQLTDQIPAEKHVIATGTTWPYRTHRKKTVDDFMQYDKNSPFIADQKSWSLREFEVLLRSGQVCAWGSCYSDRDR
jgi:hypothetical protein